MNECKWFECENMDREGIDVKTLSEMLGHATVSITMDLYCHPTLKHKQECMSKIWE